MASVVLPGAENCCHETRKDGLEMNRVTPMVGRATIREKGKRCAIHPTETMDARKSGTRTAAALRRVWSWTTG